MEGRDSFDCTPQQYHAGLDTLWAALELTGPQEIDVYTLTAEEITRLRAENDRLRADCEASADHFVSLDADRRYLWAKRRELQAAHKRLRALVGDLAKAHAHGGFTELDSDLANELATEAAEGGG